MFRFFFKKQKEVENLIGEYVRSVEIAQDMFLQSMENYLQGGPSHHALLSRDFEEEMSQAGDDTNYRARIICDYLAGMTDGFAIRIYKRLFDPDFGSIVDLV